MQNAIIKLTLLLLLYIVYSHHSIKKYFDNIVFDNIVSTTVYK